MKQLTLLRHAKTNQLSPTGRDIDRELLEKGLEQVAHLNDFFLQHPLSTKTDVWVSSATRTRQTFNGIKKTIEDYNSINSIDFSEKLYLCSQDELLKRIWKTKTNNDLMIVGHNFGISDLASYFTEKDIELATGELIQLQFECNSWKETSKGMATIVNRFRPLKDSVD